MPERKTLKKRKQCALCKTEIKTGQVVYRIAIYKGAQTSAGFGIRLRHGSTDDLFIKLCHKCARTLRISRLIAKPKSMKAVKRKTESRKHEKKGD